MAAIAIGGIFMLCISSAVGGGLRFIQTKDKDVRADQVSSDATPTPTPTPTSTIHKSRFYTFTALAPESDGPNSCRGKIHAQQAIGGAVVHDLDALHAAFPDGLSAPAEFDPSCCLEFENLNLESMSYTLFGETHTKSNIKGDTKQVLNLSETRGTTTECATDINAKFKILE